jgi:hypothetical protein
MSDPDDRRRPRPRDFVGGYTTSSGRSVSELKPPPRGPAPGAKRRESHRDDE